MIYTINAWLYKILGAGLSTRLAHSLVGKAIFKVFAGGGDLNDKRQLKVYKTKLGLKIKLNSLEAMGLGIAHLGVINKVETDLLLKLLKQGDTLIDVGAYVDGWYTLLGGKLVGNKGHVYSFEPYPDYYKRLKENIVLNNLTNITLERMGISDKIGSTFFYEAGAGSSLIENLAKKSKKKIKKVTISTTTINEYVRHYKIKNIRLLKIDIEGMEMKALEQATNVLKRKDAPDIILEVWEDHLKNTGSSEKEIIEFLRGYGYKAYVFTPNGLVKYKSGINRTMFNMFFSKNRFNFFN